MPCQAPAPEDPRYAALLAILRSAEVVWSASRPFFERWGLSAAQFNLLNLVADQPAGLSQSDLGRELLTHRSNVTGLVDRLEVKELVKRQAVEFDRRTWRINITAAGQALVDEIRPAYYRAALRVMGDWSDSDARVFIDRLTALQCRVGEAESFFTSRQIPPSELRPQFETIPS